MIRICGSFVQQRYRVLWSLFGQTIKQFDTGANVWNVFFNPSFSSKIKDDKVANEVVRIFKDSGETQQAPIQIRTTETINGERRSLTQNERLRMQEYVGKNTEKIFQRLISKGGFGDISDSAKAKIMSGLMSDVKTAAKIKILGHKPSKISKDV